MDDLLKDFGDKIQVHSRGDRIKGVVLEKRSDALVLDIGGKSEGKVAGSAFEESKGYIKNLEIGDEVEGTVIVSETPDGFTIISLRRAKNDAIWGKLQKAKKQDKAIRVMGKSVNSSGVLVDYESLLGFIPNSHIGKEKAKDVKNLVDTTFEVKILDFDREANKLVLSERLVSEGDQIKLTEKAIKNVKNGEILEGKVTTVVDFGCFVEVSLLAGKEDVKVEGLVHVSEMSWEKIESPSVMVKVGDIIKVKVIGSDNGKLALSMKQAEKDPWDDVEKKYKPDTRVTGKVVKISDFGIFVRIEAGIEGLIHITKIPPEKKFKVGDEVRAYVESVDDKERKLSLGLVLTTIPVGYK